MFVEELEFIHLRFRISQFIRVALKFIYRFEKNKFDTFLNLVKMQKINTTKSVMFQFKIHFGSNNETSH